MFSDTPVRTPEISSGQALFDVVDHGQQHYYDRKVPMYEIENYLLR